MGSYVLKEMANGMANNKKTLFPKLQIYTLFDNDKVIKYIHDYSPGLSEGIISGVLDGLAKAMKMVLPNGHSMKIDGLGVFSLSLGFDEEAGEKDKKQKDKYRHVCAKSINFKVDPKLIEEINKNSTFERNTSRANQRTKDDSTLEERKNKAIQFIQKQGFIMLDEYAIENGMSRTAASRELKLLSSDPTSGIVERGRHSHKVWVCKKE